jgi:predicted acyl esterase
MSQNRSNSVKKIGDIEMIFRKAAPLDPVEESRYPGFDQRSYTLPKGYVHREGNIPLSCDILVEQDVAVKLRDGVTIYIDIYRPLDQASCPAIIGWSPYGKRGGFLSMDIFGHPTRMDVPVHWEDGLNKFEGPNPSYWVAHGYAIIAPDPRGVCMSEGDIHAWGIQEPMDEYDLIEWVGTRPWSNGKVGLSGNSMLAMSQWFVGALRPPHLTAIAPWEGSSDIYHENACRGGIPEFLFSEGIFSHLYGNGNIEDIPAMSRAYTLFNSYWESKVAKLEKINIPAYVVASWTNLLHTAGTFRGWRQMASKDKWLRVHNTHEWNDYYNPENVEDLRRFFDHFLKGTDNGWEKTPRVRLAVLDPGNEDTLNRAEQDFPLSRQQYVTYYLMSGPQGGLLSPNPVEAEGEQAYDSADAEGTTFRISFDRDTEITGYIKLKLWVEARGNDDMDIFAFIRKIDQSGKQQQTQVVTDRGHVGPNGRLRVSVRAVDPSQSTPSEPCLRFDREEKLKPGEIVSVEIGFWPYSMRWRAGEILELVITGTDLLVRPEFPQIPPIPTINRGGHIMHTGGRYDAHLLLPVIPAD